MGATLRKSGSLGVITIENAARGNAMNREMFGELEVVLGECEGDEAISVIVLTGAGGVFCAGFDVREIYDLAMSGDRELADRHIREVRAVVERFASCPKPTIAVVEGYCLGAGFEVALACRARVVSAEARFGFPEVDLGLMPGLGGVQRLIRLIGAAEAFPIITGGQARIVSAHRAMELGIVDEVLAPQGQQAFVTMVKGFVKEIQDGLRVLNPSIVLEDPLSDHDFFLDLLFREKARESMRKFLKIPDSTKRPENEGKHLSDSAEEAEALGMLRAFVREFARKEIAPKVRTMEEERFIPAALIREMGKRGFFNATFPEEYGGQGISVRAAHVIAEEIARVHASSAVLLGAHAGLACRAVHIAGSKAQKQAYLAPALRGEKIGAFALTDESGGSDVASMKTSARKDGDHWVINGSKHFITNGTIADFAVVFAQTGSVGDNKTVTAFIIEKGTPGFEAKSAGAKMGLRASDTAILFFNDARVPQENVLGEVGGGFKTAMATLNGSRLGLCALALGEAKEAFDLAVQYSISRRVEGKPLYEKQMIQERIGGMSTWVLAIESVLWRATTAFEASGDARREIAEAKVFCTAAAIKVIDMALQMFGGAGYMEESQVERILRDARVNLIFEGTNEINTLLAAKEVLKSVLLSGRGASERS